MNFLQELAEKRKNDIILNIESDAFADMESLNEELERIVKIMLGQAMRAGIKKEDASSFLEANFVPEIKEYYSSKIDPFESIPVNYHFADDKAEIEALIAEGNISEAEAKINNLIELFNDTEVAEAMIMNGDFTAEDAEYFKNTDLIALQEAIEAKKNEEPKLSVWDRIKKGFVFITTGKNPYENKNIELETEELSEEEKKTLKEKLGDFVSRHKGKIAIGAAAALLAGGIAIGSHLHNQAQEDEPTSLEDVQNNIEQVEVEMATFEVDEYHNFNINDEQTHIEKLNLLAKAFMERGVRVVSEDECMNLANQGILAVSPEQLDNWLISMNLEDMSDLTFTKLLADSSTDKEELTSDFTRICNVLGSIYTTKEENPFIYEFISNKEYSKYIKAYEEAIIENQKGNQDSLVNLIKSRVYNPVAGTSSGSLGMLSTSLIYQQANVYNARVVGQDIMNLYNINNDCKTDMITTFYSDDWAEYTRKVNEKLSAAIAYIGSEKDAYFAYLQTLTDEQDDNKVYIENQVLLYLEKENIQLGEWDLIDEIANDRYVKSQGTGNTTNNNATISTPTGGGTTTEKVIPKEPTTEEEKKVQEETEKELEEDNRESFEDTIDKFVKNNNGEVSQNENGDVVIQLPEQEPIIVDTDTMGAYDPTKDYQGPTYNNYGDYILDHQDQAGYIPGVGNVVITEESPIQVTNPNVHVDTNGTIIDNTTNQPIITGTQDQIQNIINQHPSIGEWTVVDEGEIHYSPVDDTLSSTQSTINQGNNGNGTNSSNIGNNSNQIGGSSNLGGNNSNQIGGSSNLGGNNSTQIGGSSNLGGNNSTQIGGSQSPSIPSGVDEDVYAGLTEEEKKELDEILNGWKEPVAGEVVGEEFIPIDVTNSMNQSSTLESAIKYGAYTADQLRNNPSLCENLTADVQNQLRIDHPDIWQLYMNWVAEQNAMVAVASETETEITTDYVSQIEALEAVRAELTGEEITNELEAGKTL